jgi:hypothetical protein
VRLWDLRATQRAAMETPVHTGAVNEIVSHTLPDGSPCVRSPPRSCTAIACGLRADCVLIVC